MFSRVAGICVNLTLSYQDDESETTPEGSNMGAKGETPGIGSER